MAILVCAWTFILIRSLWWWKWHEKWWWKCFSLSLLLLLYVRSLYPLRMCQFKCWKLFHHWQLDRDIDLDLYATWERLEVIFFPVEDDQSTVLWSIFSTFSRKHQGHLGKSWNLVPEELKFGILVGFEKFSWKMVDNSKFFEWVSPGFLMPLKKCF